MSGWRCGRRARRLPGAVVSGAALVFITTSVFITTAGAAAAPGPTASAGVPARSPGHAPVSVFSAAYAVSCPQAGYCVAVGAYNANDVVNALTELWTGSSWSVLPSPQPPNAASSVLNAVSCTSAAQCVAVGSYTDSNGVTWGLAEVWNGAAWSIVDSPTPTGGSFAGLSGVSCSGASQCVAVGSYTNSRNRPVPLAESWDGSAWTIVPTPRPTGARATGLDAVSCASATTCMATGSYFDADFNGRTLAESWDGAAWTIVPSPNPDGAQGSYLAAVSCPTSSECMAVGGYQDSTFTPVTLAESWDGSHWAIVDSPTPAGSPDSALSGVSCASATRCLAVGRSYSPSFAGKDDTLAESWDGSHWAIVGSPSPSTTSNLDAVSCASPARCLAVGLFFNSSGNYETLAETWDGSSLSIRNQDAVLAGVACRGAASCVAVGSYLARDSVSATLAERWNGRSWSTVRTPNPADSEGSYLEAVTCVGANRCFAVGYYYRLDNTRLTLIEEWDGRQWSIVASPNVRHAAYSVLYGISCASTSRCMAVGSAAGRVLAESWNGSAWTIVPTADPDTTAYSELTGVSCSSGRQCLAVGYETDTLYHADLPLAEQWNGTAWSIVPSAAPGRNNFQSSMLRGMSCTTAGGCLAVGLHQKRTGSFGTFAERWTGQGWAVVASPSPAGAAFSELRGLSCFGTGQCLAVGNSFDQAGEFVPLSETWTGTAWRIETGPDVGAQADGISYLLDVYCPGSVTCLATGSQGDPANLEPLSAVWDGSAWLS